MSRVPIGVLSGMPGAQFTYYMQPSSNMYYQEPSPYQQVDYSYVPQELKKLFTPPSAVGYNNQNCFVGGSMPQPWCLVDGGTTYYKSNVGIEQNQTVPESPSPPRPRARPIYQGVRTCLDFLDPKVKSRLPKMFRRKLRRHSGTLLSIIGKYDNDTWLDIVSFEFKVANFTYVNGGPVLTPVATVWILSKYDGRLGFQFEILNAELAENCKISVEALQEICESICL